mgnify:CR=1 FL=1
MDKVFIRGLKVEGIIGIFQWEREVKQVISIDIEMEVFISIGSNIDASKNMEIVRDHLKVFKDISYSSIYSTPAEGFDGEDFLNCVCKFHSTENPHELRRILKNIERLY